MKTGSVSKGVIAAFDVFSKKETAKINDRIGKILGVESEVQKSAFFGGSSETKCRIWNLPELENITKVFKNTYKKADWAFDNNLMKKYVENFQVWGYDSPSLPYYIVIARIQLRKESLALSQNLRTDLWKVGLSPRFFIESLEGYYKTKTLFKPNAPFVTQLWTKISKKHFLNMRKTAITLFEQKEELSPIEKRELSTKLRKLEPVSLSAQVGDIHSHILSSANVTLVLGHMSQIALGGLMTPFIEYLSYDDKLLGQIHELPMGPFEVLIGGGWNIGYTHLIGLLSLWIYLGHISVEREKIDKEVSELRDVLTSEEVLDKIEQSSLDKLNRIATHAASLQQIIGRFSRRWKRMLRQKSEGKEVWVFEIPVENVDSFSMLDFEKGYYGTITSEILAILDNIKQFLDKQATEISSLRTCISDIANLRVIRSNRELQKTMKYLAKVSVAVGILALTISVFNWILDLVLL